MSGWWLDPHTDWSTGDPFKVVELLATAYPSYSQAKRVIQVVGISLDGGPSEAMMGEKLWLTVLRAAARKAQTLGLAAAVLGDSDASHFHLLLLGLLGPQLADLVYRHGVPSESRQAVLTVLDETRSEPTDSPLEGFQAIQSPASGLRTLDSLVQTVHAAARRVAMIEKNGKAAGTGMLVGDDLLLTAGHVLGSKLWPPGSLAGFNAVFDYYEQGRPPSETGVRVAITELLAESPPTEPESLSAAQTNWDAATGELDYALLRLARPVADDAGTLMGQTQRGFYPLTSEPYDFAHTDLLFIAQHPLGQYQAYTYSAAAEVNGNKTRIRYMGNTLEGSSGSPVFDPSGRLVGMHHYSARKQNQAVTISSIHDAIVERLGEGVLSPPPAITPSGQAAPLPVAAPMMRDPYLVRVVGGKPLVDRVPLRGEFRDMAGTDGRRTLVIDGQIESGVSTSYQLMAHVAAVSHSQPQLIPLFPDGLKVIPIDLRKYRGLPVAHQRARIIDILCMHLLSTPATGIAQTAREVETLKHSWMIQLQKSKQQHWIFVDSIDSAMEVSQSGLDELLRALAELANDSQNPLRLVLAGRQASAVAERTLDLPAKDQAVGLSRTNVEDWVRGRASEEGKTVLEPKLVSRLDELFPAGSPNPKLRFLVLRLPAMYLEVTG